MKKFLLSLFAMSTFWSARADEGMWIPMLINKNIAEMQKLGFKLSAEDVYSINNASLKDAIVHFGGGCTGEMISSTGLLITNHHCGYGNIADASTVENNYLRDGFWAKSLAQEIPAKGLSVKFLVYMKDVTNELSFRGRDAKSASAERAKRIENMTKIASEGGKYEAQVSSYFNNNQYFLLVYEVFEDVRLVGTPPESLGKYGGDTDNWIWPRHTADFSMFRVYAGRNNRPAKYSKDNVPYRPKKFLPISIKEIKDADYAMVMGYPGRTNRYATSYELDMAINDVNPSIVKLRDTKLSIMRKYMKQDEAVDLKLSSRYAQIANYWKYYIGQTEQLKRLKVLDRKRAEEKDYTAWVAQDEKKNSQLMSQFAAATSAYRPYAKSVVYTSEGFYGSGLLRLAAATKSIKDALSEPKVDANKVKKEAAALKSLRERVMETYVLDVEKETLAKITQMIYQDLPADQLPAYYNKTLGVNYGNLNSDETYTRFSERLFAQSFLVNENAFNSFINNPSLKVLNEDPAVEFAESYMKNFNENIAPKLDTYNAERAKLAKEYTANSLKKQEGALVYPDANSTMRVTYGTVGGYSPQDAVYYDYKTNMDGLLAKYIPGDDEFDLPADFLELARKKDWGPYGDANGDLIINFITNNDITGGNSGSPVINDKGELIGLAFDGNWEAMSGDIAFDKKYKKTIAVDSRFVLWLIEKYGKATNIINELDIRR